MEILKVEHLTKVYGEGETATSALLQAASCSMASMSIRAAMKSLQSSVAVKWDSCISSIIWFLFSMWSRI